MVFEYLYNATHKLYGQIPIPITINKYYSSLIYDFVLPGSPAARSSMSGRKRKSSSWPKPSTCMAYITRLGSPHACPPKSSNRCSSSCASSGSNAGRRPSALTWKSCGSSISMRWTTCSWPAAPSPRTWWSSGWSTWRRSTTSNRPSSTSSNFFPARFWSCLSVRHLRRRSRTPQTTL